jgi:predicted GIY-YIG superfamily endonuclease
MPKVEQIDWGAMPRVSALKGRKQKRRIAKRNKTSRLQTKQHIKNSPVINKPTFQPILPNRDRYKLQHELSLVDIEMKKLQAKRDQIITDIKEIKRRQRADMLSPVSLYALQLEDGCYYIGMTFDVIRRFKKHGTGKGAAWTRLHKPIQILEVRETKFYDQDEVAKLEDDMTLEYALKYGSDKVRGGGYCQAKPRWPPVVTENERVIVS